MEKVDKQTLEIIQESVRSCIVTRDGMTGSVKVKGGLRDCYFAIERALQIETGKLSNEIKHQVRYIYDKIVAAAGLDDNDTRNGEFEHKQTSLKYALRDQQPYQAKLSRWERPSVTVREYPQVICQFKSDIVRLKSAKAKLEAEGNQEAASKLAGKIRNLNNSIITLESEYDGWVKSREVAKVEAEASTTSAELVPLELVPA